jgi:hypothetical protein
MPFRSMTPRNTPPRSRFGLCRRGNHHRWDEHAESANRAAIAVAERLRGTRHRLDPTRVRSRRRGGQRRGLHRVLTAYVTYYMQSRTHLALEKDAPISRPVTPGVGRADRRDVACWRAPPPLRPQGGLAVGRPPVTTSLAVSPCTSTPKCLLLASCRERPRSLRE